MVDKSNNPDVDEEARLERHIDEMMDPKLPDPVSAKPGSLPGAPELPEIDIFKDSKKPELAALQTETAEDKDARETAEPLPVETDMSGGETSPQAQRPIKKDTGDEKI